MMDFTANGLTGVIAAAVTYIGRERIGQVIDFVTGRPKPEPVPTNGKAGEKDVAFWQKDNRDGFREIQNQTIVPMLNEQNAELKAHTQLLTKAVTLLEVLSHK